MTIRIHDILASRIGLQAESLGRSVVPKAIEGRMKLLGLGDAADYAQKLESTLEEFQALMEEVIVAESWFFRGGELFAYLAKQISEMSRPVRVLCVPCCSGEEPYSLAIALQERGARKDTCVIEAVDLSPRLIEIARQGCYKAFSFRQTPDALRSKYFQPAADSWQIRDSIRTAVRYREGNVVSTRFLEGEKAFDIILCRNLFIYLTPEARKLVLDNLHRLLAPTGELYMGPAEPINDGRFARAGSESFFQYRRNLIPIPPTSNPSIHAPFPNTYAPLPTPSHSPLPTPQPPVDMLASAHELADNGEVDAALECCLAALVRTGPEAELFHLMGVLHLARRDQPEATRCFRKALYLQPDHAEAITHLMLLYQESGDQAQAEVLRDKLGRINVGDGS